MYIYLYRTYSYYTYIYRIHVWGESIKNTWKYECTRKMAHFYVENRSPRRIRAAWCYHAPAPSPPQASASEGYSGTGTPAPPPPSLPPLQCPRALAPPATPRRSRLGVHGTAPGAPWMPGSLVDDCCSRDPVAASFAAAAAAACCACRGRLVRLREAPRGS